MRKIAIISPSGNFYGSEQVLFDFLSTTSYQYTVYVTRGLLYEKVNEQGVHILRLFSSVKVLYLQLGWMLLCGKYDGVYINEGGHIKYLNLLADLFPHKHFYVHVRLLEDCQAIRLGKKRKNISYISISEYITHEVKRNTGIACHTMYDIYNPISGVERIHDIQLRDNTLHLGIVGRVTTTKGLNDISQFCDYCEQYRTPFLLVFHFYGGVDSHIPEVEAFVTKTLGYKNMRCIFHGFINKKEFIYSSIDILVHFNKVEAWGRVLMEALDFGIPFVGFDSGGVGELAYQFEVGNYMVSCKESWQQVFQKRIVDMITQSEKTTEDYQGAKEKMKVVCNPETYTQKLEYLFYE